MESQSARRRFAAEHRKSFICSHEFQVEGEVALAQKFLIKNQLRKFLCLIKYAEILFFTAGHPHEIHSCGCGCLLE